MDGDLNCIQLYFQCGLKYKYKRKTIEFLCIFIIRKFYSSSTSCHTQKTITTEDAFEERGERLQYTPFTMSQSRKVKKGNMTFRNLKATVIQLDTLKTRLLTSKSFFSNNENLGLKRGRAKYNSQK